MKILQISEYYFNFSGILVLNKSRSASIWAFLKNIFIVFLMGPFLCETTAAFIYFNSDKFEDCVISLAGLSAGFLVTGKYLSLKIEEKRIKELIKTFQETVDEGFA